MSDLTDAYCRAYDQLVTSVNAKVRCRETAQDIVQDAWLKLAATPASAAIAEPRAYVFRLVGNLALDALRRRAFQRIWFTSADAATERVGEPPRAEARLIAKERARRLKIAIASLGPQRRQVYLMRQIDGLSHAEIAARLKITVGTAEKHMARALVDLRAALADESA